MESAFPSPRFLLYGHDSWGLGHLRRNLNLATSLVDSFPGAGVLLVSGSPCATSFDTPPGVDVLKLPSITKDSDGGYVSRRLPGNVAFVVRLRKKLLLEAFRSFAPHLLIVDHQVLGVHGEALDTLREARRTGTKTILGIRDVIDSPETVAREWSSDECRWALSEGYDRLCVYGAPEVLDPRVEYPIPAELGERMEFTGYVVQESDPRSRRPVPSTRPQVLVAMGGGEDGGARLDGVLDAHELGKRDWDTVLLTGPLLDRREARRLKRRLREIGGIEMHRFHKDVPRLLEESDLVVSMAGYNTCAEVMQSRKPAIYLPRVFPRREQEIRAGRLAALGLGSCLVSPSPTRLRQAMERALQVPHRPERTPALCGNRRMCEVAAEVLSLDSQPRRVLQ